MQHYLKELINCPNHSALKDYEVQVLIGQGAFGSVKRAIIKNTDPEKQVALKQYDKSKL